MAEISALTPNGWYQFIEAMGIIAGMVFSGVSLLFVSANYREDAENKLIASQAIIDERFDKLQDVILEKPELSRIIAETADLSAKPVTVQEIMYVKRIIQHYESGWRIELKRGELDTLARDAAYFFSLPVPAAVWRNMKRFRNPGFVQFVRRALEADGR